MQEENDSQINGREKILVFALLNKHSKIENKAQYDPSTLAS